LTLTLGLGGDMSFGHWTVSDVYNVTIHAVSIIIINKMFYYSVSFTS